MRCQVRCTVGGKARRLPLVVHEGFDLAEAGSGHVLRISNRGGNSPLLVEQLVLVEPGSPTVHVLARATTQAGVTAKDVSLQASCAQDFNWLLFASAGGGPYGRLAADATGRADAFLAFSPGMRRGVEIAAVDGCALHYRLGAMNAWQVSLTAEAAKLDPGESLAFGYAVRVVGRRPDRPTVAAWPDAVTLGALTFRRLEPARFRPAPIQTRGRVMLRDVIAGLQRPKVRGLNLRARAAQAPKDLKTLKDWGCNLVITSIGQRDQTARLIELGHQLGMEMLVSGRGSYTKGPPSFEALYSSPLPPPQRPDSHGQDEDHYYWYAIPPAGDFEADFGKPMCQATQEEKVRFWARSFVAKWRGVAAGVKPSAPDAGLWFYSPSPGIAGVDPLDDHDLFFREIATLGDRLTVLPFYYGIEYSQAEYMCRRWKDAGTCRVVFLPMRGFMVKPSQFIRAITAARRGQAEGACGFAFPVGDEKPGQEWQWKAAMLGAWANFPTPELPAWCFIEEPAELVEALADAAVAVEAAGVDARAFEAKLRDLLPQGQRRLAIRVAATWPESLRSIRPLGSQGVIQMRGDTVSLCGTDAQGAAQAMDLLVRFAELARAERGK